MAPLTPDSTIARFLDRSGPGIQQLAYRVTSITHAMDAVRVQGMRVLYDEPRRGTAGSRINFIHPKDAGGVLVELIEPTAD
jgi:methylmalonyl-CoA/ethylmalonyl-CoA epimerase